MEVALRVGEILARVLLFEVEPSRCCHYSQYANKKSLFSCHLTLQFPSRAIGEVAVLGDGVGNLGLDSGAFSGVGEKNSTEAIRVLPKFLDLSTATLGDTGT